MWIKNISIENCRLLKSISLDLSPDLNIIIGPNASGKTSLLESLTLLSKGRSFRTSHIREVISKNEDVILVAAEIVDRNSTSRIGIKKSKTKTTIRINKKDIYSQAELSSFLPITVIHPNSIELIIGSPSIRRSFIDWIAFYKYPDFHNHWKQYQHVLKQRNMCLKSHKHSFSLDKWTEQLIQLQPIIVQYRNDVIAHIQPFLQNISESLLKNKNIEIQLENGFPDDVKIEPDNLMSFYNSKKEYDFKIKRTSYGSHRADLKILLNGTPAVQSASRGQLKLLTICLLLAQNSCISDTDINNGILLIDDLAAELDATNKKLLLNYLSKLQKQLIITSTNEIHIENITSKVFHVKHGEIHSK